MIKRFLFFATLAAMVAGCYPGGADYAEELDLVLTTYDKQYTFSTSNTYAIPDKIPKIKGSLGNDLPVYLDAATTKVILDGIKSNMTSLGYTEVAVNADVVLTVAALEVTTTTVYCNDWWGYWGWWSYYPGYPGYGGCYYPSVYSYSTGTLLISMVDDRLEDGKPETPVVGVWGGALNGILTGSSSSTNTRITNGINQIFKQSPYLKTN